MELMVLSLMGGQPPIDPAAIRRLKNRVDELEMELDWFRQVLGLFLAKQLQNKDDYALFMKFLDDATKRHKGFSKFATDIRSAMMKTRRLTKERREEKFAACEHREWIEVQSAILGVRKKKCQSCGEERAI